MTRVRRDLIVAEGLRLLDEVGLDLVSTRTLARRLGVEQPTLYHHVDGKEDLLAAMAQAAMDPVPATLPPPPPDSAAWLCEHARCFRRALLRHRDGARLHIGWRDRADAGGLAFAIAVLASAGLEADDAATAVLAVHRFTLGGVLEEQANAGGGAWGAQDHEAVFERGLAALAEGLAVVRA